LLRFEQQLQAYQKLHGDELAELWRELNDCKRDLTANLPADGSNGAVPGDVAKEKKDIQEDGNRKT
jgi:diadenosine tetraphosphate (Ap4A) HIT family hydrolase